MLPEARWISGTCRISHIDVLSFERFFGVRRFANPAYYTGNITYTNLPGTRHTYWEVPVQSTSFHLLPPPTSNSEGIRFTGLTINDHLIDAGNTIAALDTGTSLSQ